MLTLQKAEALAGAWVEVVCDGLASLQPELTMERPYGWLFFYNSKAFIRSGRSEDALLGNAPIIVHRFDGGIRITGPARPIAKYLAEYEKSLPSAMLKASPRLGGMDSLAGASDSAMDGAPQ